MDARGVHDTDTKEGDSSILHARLDCVRPLPSLNLDLFGVRWQIHCDDDRAVALIARNFSEFVSAAHREGPSHRINIRSAPSGWILESKLPPIEAEDTYDLLYHLEKVLTIDAQVQRSDLFFLHSAVLGYRNTAFLLVASSGSGKSTTAWALANRGFGYLSDELAPIDLTSFTVEPYPHALCLKSRPPAPFEIPRDAIVTSRTLHIPTTSIPDVVRQPMPLRAVFFNRFDHAAATPRVSPLGRGETSALLYSHALNPLAHDQAGLRGVATIATRTQGYALTTGDLEQTCDLVRATLDGLLRSG